MPVNPIVLMYAYIKGIAPSAKYIPITLTNSQSSITPTPFQQLININPTSIGSSYFSSDLGNIRFYADLAFTQPLYAWVESGNSNTSTSTNIWVNLPNGIPANSSITIYMKLLPIGTEYDGVYMGEAPQLSPTYGQYDNGASVFNNYWNFAGTVLPSGWSGSGYTVNNGLTITCPSGNANYLSSPLSLGMNSNLIWSAYFYNLPSFSSGNYEIGFGPKQTSSPWYFAGLGSYTSTTGLGSLYFIGTAYENYTTTWNSNGVYSALWQNNYIYTAFNEGTFTNQLSASTAFSANLTIMGFDHASSGSFNFSVSYVYTRTYPPNGVMPTVSVGSFA